MFRALVLKRLISPCAFETHAVIEEPKAYMKVLRSLWLIWWHYIEMNHFRPTMFHTLLLTAWMVDVGDLEIQCFIKSTVGIDSSKLTARSVQGRQEHNSWLTHIAWGNAFWHFFEKGSYNYKLTMWHQQFVGSSGIRHDFLK